MTFNFLIFKMFIEKFSKMDFSVSLKDNELILDLFYWRVYVF
jgi:hypothetical protein